MSTGPDGPDEEPTIEDNPPPPPTDEEPKASSRPSAVASDLRASVEDNARRATAATSVLAACTYFLLAASIYSWSVIQHQTVAPAKPIVPPYAWRREFMAPWYTFAMTLALLSLASILDLVKEDKVVTTENYVTMSLKTIGLTMLTGELLDAMCLRGLPELHPGVWAAIGVMPVVLYSYDSERHEDRSTSIANLIILVCSFIQVFLAVNYSRYWLLVCPVIFALTYAEGAIKRFDGDTYLYLAIMSIIYAHVVDDLPMIFTHIGTALAPPGCCDPLPPKPCQPSHPAEQC